ncbi:unnamed protein product [Symbiodinium sp. CCMP2592]|nr:unnamed protein product [Symbiodinium sp. CCMP2592]
MSFTTCAESCRRALSFVIPTAIIVDFYSAEGLDFVAIDEDPARYGTDQAMQEIYLLKDEVARPLNYGHIASLSQGVHVRVGVLHPDLLVAISAASVCRTWYRAVLPLVQLKPYVNSGRTARLAMQHNTTVMVQVFSEPQQLLANEEIIIPIEQKHNIVVNTLTNPLGLFGQAVSTRRDDEIPDAHWRYS